MNTVSALAPACPLMRGWNGVCRCCGKELVGRQATWCGPVCRATWDDNHWWTQARAAIRRRAEVYDMTRPPGYSVINGRHTAGRFLGQVCWECDAIVARVEVDHVRPAMGAHDVASCVHHLDNLRAVCIPCHRRITREQRATPKSRARRARMEARQNQAPLL